MSCVLILRNAQRWVLATSSSFDSLHIQSSLTGNMELINVAYEYLKPQIPNEWEFHYQDAGWSTIYPQGISNNKNIIYCKQVIDGRDLNRNGKGVFALLAYGEIGKRLIQFAQNSDNAWTFGELRNQNTVLTRAIKNNWPTISGSVQMHWTIAGHDFLNLSERFATLVQLSSSLT